jgi:translation initiation factor IF-2
MTLEASVQNIADAIREFTKLYGEQIAAQKQAPQSVEVAEVKAPKPPKSKSAVPVVEPVAAPTPVAVSEPVVEAVVAPTPPAPPAPPAEPDPFAAEVPAPAATYDEVVAALRSLASAPSKGREAVIAILSQFGAKSVPELGTKPDLSLAAVLAAAKAAMA